jgi:hypothetical protein
MVVDASDITGAIRGLGLGGMAVCLHASLRSFGRVDGGAAAVVDGILAAGCTLLVPSFTSRFAVAPPPGAWLDRNGWPTAPYPRVANHAIARGLVAQYQTLGENAPSMRVAAALGFYPYAEFTYAVVRQSN